MTRAVCISAKGVSIYNVHKQFGFLDPLPLVTYRNHLILLLLSAFWGPLPPPTADVIYGSPLRQTGRQTSHHSSFTRAVKILALATGSTAFFFPMNDP